MASWKKIIVSGSNAELNQLTATSYGGNISGSAASTGSFGHLELANRDTDASFEFGRAHVGFIGYSDMAGFSHVDNDSTANFSLAQSAAGKTIINAKSGQPIAFKINNSDVVQISSAGNLGVGIETATEKLHVVGNVFATGNISGSSTSTGSFGHIKTIDGITARGPFEFTTTSAANDTIFQTAGTAGNPLKLKNSNASAKIDFQTNSDVANILMSNNSKNNLLLLSADGNTETRGRVGSAHADGNLELYSNNGLNNLILSASMTTISGSGDTTLDVKGKLLGDGSSLTGIVTDLSSDTTPQLGGNLDLNSNNITGTGNIDILGTITAQNFIVSSSVTSIEYQSLSGSTIFGDTEDDTHEFIGHVMMQSASFGMANHADRTNSNAANSYLFISQSVASKNGYVWQKAGNPGTNTFPFLLIDASNGQKASIRQDGRFSTPLVYLSNDNSGKLGEIDGDAGDSSAMYINANSRALQLSSEGRKTFKINTDGTTEIGGSGAYGVTNFGDLTVGGNLNLTASAATLEVAGNISGSAQSTGSFGKLLGDGSSLTGITATSNVVDDTSPQLGGELDLNSNDITGTGNINMVGTHQITGSLSISGSTNTVTINAAGSDAVGLLINGNVASQTPSIKFASSAGNLQGGTRTIAFTNNGFTIGGNVGITGGAGATSGFNTSNRGSQGALTSGNGGDAGIGFVGGGGQDAAIDFQTADTTRLQIEVDGTITIVGDTVIGGNLTVNGDTTTISTTNILVQDAFGFFATGSAGTNVDAGIIVQSGSFIDSGSALYHDISKERWSVGKGVASTATNVPDSKWGGFVATVYTGSASPVGDAPKYGVGEIHVDGDGEIYIYS